MPSHPSRVCGLKSGIVEVAPADDIVTPFTGVWIEMCPTCLDLSFVRCHTLHGCVD